MFSSHVAAYYLFRTQQVLRRAAGPACAAARYYALRYADYRSA